MLKNLVFLCAVLIGFVYAEPGLVKFEVKKGQIFQPNDAPPIVLVKALKELQSKPDGFYFYDQQANIVKSETSDPKQKSEVNLPEKQELKAPDKTSQEAKLPGKKEVEILWIVEDWKIMLKDGPAFCPKDKYNLNVLEFLGKSNKKLVVTFKNSHYRTASGKISSYDEVLLKVRAAWIERVKNFTP